MYAILEIIADAGGSLPYMSILNKSGIDDKAMMTGILRKMRKEDGFLDWKSQHYILTDAGWDAINRNPEGKTTMENEKVAEEKLTRRSEVFDPDAIINDIRDYVPKCLSDSDRDVINAIVGKYSAVMPESLVQYLEDLADR